MQLLNCCNHTVSKFTAIVATSNGVLHDLDDLLNITSCTSLPVRILLLTCCLVVCFKHYPVVASLLFKCKERLIHLSCRLPACQLYLLLVGVLLFPSRIYIHPRGYSSPWAATPAAVKSLKPCYQVASAASHHQQWVRDWWWARGTASTDLLLLTGLSL